MTRPLFQVDAFTDVPFAGNPAAVCLCFDALPEEDQFQQIAAEMNLSETAFLVTRPAPGLSGIADDRFDLYWFTPTQEVDLCGHATLAAAHVLWEEGHVPPNVEITFHTRSGQLAARRREKDHWIQLDFPAEPVQECDAPADLTDALGATPSFTGRNRMDLLALFDDEQTVRDLRPDFRLLREIDRGARTPTRGVIATAEAAAGAGYHFVSRFFGPRVGVDEDPVTGSAHCALAPFWSERLGKKRLTGRQVSERGGTVRCEARGERDGAGYSVTLGGQAVTVLRGELEL
jgi:PhzF family phenazine biosynthesis protein